MPISRSSQLLTEGEHIVEAVRATPQEAKGWRIKEHDPCLLIRRRTGPRRTLVRMPGCFSWGIATGSQATSCHKFYKRDR